MRSLDRLFSIIELIFIAALLISNFIILAFFNFAEATFIKCSGRIQSFSAYLKPPVQLTLLVKIYAKMSKSSTKILESDLAQSIC